MPKPPQPTAIAKLRGNPGHRPLAENEPQPRDLGRCPDPPGSLDDYEREVWDEIAPMLYEMGVLTVVDVDALATYCRAKVRYIDANEIISVDGHTRLGSAGNTVVHPEIYVMEKAATEMHRIWQNFGMTPAARTRIAATPPASGENKRFDGTKRAG